MNRLRLPLLPANRWTRWTSWTATLALCSAITLYSALVPIVRACYRAEVITNEGWNLYFAMAVSSGKQLYPHKYGWTTNNYPMLSFAILAWLHRFTHDYLFTGRAVSLLSLLAISALAGALVFRLTKNRHAALLAGLFCIALFCANADLYVGADEPQLLAHVFFLGGFCLAMAEGGTYRLILAALLFAIGGSIKYNLVDMPVAVLIGLALQSSRRAVVFALSCVSFAALAVALNLHFGGPHFLDEITLPRDYSWVEAARKTGIFLGPVLFPLILAGWMARSLLRRAPANLLSVELVLSILLGFYFSGGSGVSVSAFFSAAITMSILVGMVFAEAEGQNSAWARKRYAAWLPAASFAWLIIPMLISGNWNPVASLRATKAAEERFDAQVSFLRTVSGPAICESSLLCAAAGQPFLYDPFNATRLIEYGKLDQQPMLDALREHRMGTVALDASADDSEYHHERLSPAMLAAIRQYYAPASQSNDETIYLPRTGAAAPVPGK